MSTLRIAAVQMSIQWLDKKANLNYLDGLLDQLEQQDLIVLPETFSTGFAIELDDIAEPEEGGVVLKWMLLKADGQVEYYDKRHLFRLGNEQDHVNPGNERKIIHLNNIRILPVVCYDLRFPVWSRNRNDYDLMVNVANWPSMRQEAWNTLLKARAMENQAYVVGVNRVGNDGKGTPHSGGTVIYDYAGNLLSQANKHKEEVITAEIDLNKLAKFKCKYPFFMDGDEFDIKINN